MNDGWHKDSVVRLSRSGPGSRGPSTDYLVPLKLNFLICKMGPIVHGTVVKPESHNVNGPGPAKAYRNRSFRFVLVIEDGNIYVM